MKINKIAVVCIVFLALLSLSCVSASDNSTACEIPSQDDASLEINEDVHQDLDVEVTNVFNGYENTITVNYPNATGNVDITVGDKTYNPTFIDGKATQVVSDYENGVNNVSVKYNNLTRETSFKVLDGVVTYKTFYDYFNESNNYTLQDYIPDGVTLDFQGNITYIDLNKTEDFNILSIVINKPVNIISTTGDAFIDFNGNAGSLLGEYQGSTFTINNAGSWSNVTGITIHNTQVWIYNTHHVTLDRIKVLVEDARIGSGVGATSVRANSTWCTVKNSYFYTRNNGGSSTLVMAWADYCTFDNNTIEAEGNVGNLMYTTTYNVDFPVGVVPNCHNNLTNNVLTGKGSDISWMIVISGQDTLIENNTVYSSGVGINSQWIDRDWYGGDAVPTRNMYIGNKLYGGCSMVVSSNSIACDNYVSGEVRTYSNITFCNNYVGGTLSIPKDGYFIMENNTILDVIISSNDELSVYRNNTFNSLTIEADGVLLENNVVNNGVKMNARNVQLFNNTFSELIVGGSSSNTTLESNVISDLVILSDGNTITKNNIISKNDYAIDLKKTTGNTVTNNYLLSSKEFGNSAVKSANENIIKDNYPIAPDVLINVELVNNFENIATVTVPNSSGSVVIQVSDKKYTLTLSKGVAIQRISGLGPGNYTLTVNYKDDESPVYASNETTITVPKIDAYTFEVKETEFMEGNVIIPFNLPSDSDGKVVINGIEGNTCVALDLTEGEYSLEVKYINSQKYADKTIQLHIKVVHNPNAVLTLQNITTYDLSGKVIVNLTNYKNDPIANAVVIININGKDIEVKTNELGIASVDYNLVVGSYKLTASFKGDNNYNAASSEAKIEVLSRFSGNKNIVMDYYDGSKYNVCVIGDDGKPVGSGQIITFNINGKKSTVNTDKNGYASLTIVNVPGKYSITATYKGQSVKNSIQVKQTLKTSKVTVKKSAKSFNIKATLKTSKNKPIKGKKITFKFNGKTYTAKTDKNGVAKVTIKQNVIKKLKKGKKYAFTAKYVSDTIKNQVIVK